MTDIDIAALRKLHESATPPPWSTMSSDEVCRSLEMLLWTGRGTDPMAVRGPNEELVATLRNLLPAIIEAVEEAERMKKEVVPLVDELKARVRVLEKINKEPSR